MVTDLLIQKVREKIKAGVGEGIIKSNLMMEGWPLSDIEEAIDIEMKGKTPVKVVKKMVSPLVSYIGMTILGIVLTGLIGLLAMKVEGMEVVLPWSKNTGTNSTGNTTNEGSENNAAVGPTASPTEVAQAKPVEIVNPLSDKDYIDAKDKYRIKPPRDWEVDTSGKLGAPVYFLGPQTVTEDNFAYKASINVMTGPANNNTVEGYVDFYLKALGQKLEGFKVSEKRKIVVSGRNMMIVRDTFIAEGQKFTGMSLLLVDLDKVYIVTGTALTSGYDQVKEAIDQSIYSFNVL